MSEEKPTKDDHTSLDRQNMYLNDTKSVGKLYSARQAAEMTGYSPVTVRVLHRQLQMAQKVDGRPLFSVDDISKLHDLKSHRQRGGDAMAKVKQERRQPMDGRATMWELYQANQGKIVELNAVIRKIRDEIWDARKSLGVVAGDLEELRAEIGKLKKEESGRGVSILGRTAPLTPEPYEAEAA